MTRIFALNISFHEYKDSGIARGAKKTTRDPSIAEVMVARVNGKNNKLIESQHDTLKQFSVQVFLNLLTVQRP